MRLLLAILLAFGVALPARADDTDAVYQREVEMALSLHQAGEYEQAQRHMEAAHGLAPSARTLRGLGIIAHARCDYPRALGLFESALGEQVKPLEGELRSSVERLLASAREKVGRYRIQATPSTALFTIDGISPVRDAEGDVVLLPGSHVLALSAPAHVTQRVELTSVAGDHRLVPVTLAREVPAVDAPAVADHDPRMRQRRAGIALMVVGPGLSVIGLGSMIAGAAKGVSSRIDWCFDPESSDCADERAAQADDRDQARTLKRLGGALLGLGVVGFGVGLAVWRHGAKSRPTLTAHARGAALTLRF